MLNVAFYPWPPLDASGNIRTAKAAESTHYDYDALGRAYEVTEYAGADRSLFSYRTINSFDPITGGVTQVTNVAGPASGVGVGNGAVQSVVNHSYSPSTGRLLSTWTGDNANVTSYRYDALGRLAFVDVTKLNGVTLAATQTTQYLYDNAGNLQTQTLPNGDTTTYTYDDLNRLTDETVTVAASQDLASNVLAEFTYTLYDNGLRKTELDRQRASTSTTAFSTTALSWQYDDLGRLTLETRDAGNNGPGAGDEADAFGFDLAGNRMYKHVFFDGNTALATSPSATGYDGRIGYQYDAGGDDQLIQETAVFTAIPIGFTGTTADESYVTVYGHDTGPGVFAKGYDANGSLLESHRSGGKPADTANFYDLRNRLAKIVTTQGGVTTTSTEQYDSGGDKVRETVGTVSGTTTTTTTTLYVNDDANPTGYSQTLEEKASPSAAPTRSYVLGANIIAQSDATTVAQLATKELFFETDGHGSTRALLDATGNVATGQIFAYDAYGNIIQDPLHPVSPMTSILYTGERFDASINQYFLRARYYDPANGRFGSFDSYEGKISDPMSLHKYAYGNSNPILLGDPSGHFSVADILTSMGVSEILSSASLPIIRPAATFLTQTLFGALLPPNLLEMWQKLTWDNTSAIMVGGNVGYTWKSGPFGGGVTGGAELLWSPYTHNVGVFGFLEGNVSIGGFAGLGTSVKAGPMFNFTNLSDYSGSFRSLTLSYRLLPKKFQSVFTEKLPLLTLPLGGYSGLNPDIIPSLGRALLHDGKFLLNSIFGNLQNKTLTISWSPGKVGAFGWSIESQFTEDGSAGLATGFQYYWLLAGNPDARMHQ